MNRIYMDHAATTPVHPVVFEAMKPYFAEKYANAASIHSMGQEAKEALENSRATVAKFLGVSPEHIYFTSGATESNNTIIKGLAFSTKKGLLGKRGHIVTSRIEHPCIMNTCEWLKTQGFDVTYVPVDPEGIVQPDVFEKSLRKDTIVASIMTANNEIGTIQPIKELSKISKDHGVPFHTDAVQAYGKIPLDLENVDALSVSAHKLYGPKGVGILYSRIPFTSYMHGGGHEAGQRAGTSNVVGIVGLAMATELAAKRMGNEGKRQTAMRDRLIKGLLELPNSRLNGHATQRLPNNINVSIVGVEGESLVLMLDAEGIEASTGSACSSNSLKPSHVLIGLGLKHVEAHGSLRFTLGTQNTEQDIDYVLEKTPPIVEKLAEMSPFNPQEEKYEDECFKSSD